MVSIMLCILYHTQKKTPPYWRTMLNYNRIIMEFPELFFIVNLVDHLDIMALMGHFKWYSRYNCISQTNTSPLVSFREKKIHSSLFHWLLSPSLEKSSSTIVNTDCCYYLFLLFRSPGREEWWAFSSLLHTYPSSPGPSLWEPPGCPA